MKTRPFRIWTVAVVLSSVFAAFNLEAAPAPSITTQPRSQTNFFGSNVVFTVAATGQTPLFYQWSFDGTNLTDNGHISGSTTTNLTVNSITASDAGNYRVVVTNSHGSATSSNAILTVLVPATITIQPTNQSVLLSNNVTFTAAATGTAPLNYRWYFNGTALADGGRVNGSGTANLTIFDVQTNDAGLYQLVVTNNYRMATSAVATLTVLIPATITSSPTNESVLQNSNVTFTAAAIGTAPLSYQWYFNGSPLADGGGVSGSGTTNLNLSNVQTNEAGSYQLVVTNNYGLATSAVAVLTVLVPPAIVTQPAGEIVSVNASVTFSVVATGSTPAYQWQKDGINLVDGGQISGATSPNLTLTGMLATNAGTYQVVVTNVAGTVTSGGAVLNVVPVVIWGDNSNGENNVPANATNVVAIAVGGTHVLALRADGSLVGWGDNSWGQISIPPDATNIVAIAAGELPYSLAVRDDGTVLGWGYNVYGEASPPASATNVIAVAAHTVHGMGLRGDGTAVGWGYDDSGITDIPAFATNLVALSIGSDFDIGLRADGQVVGWGYNDFGAPVIPAVLTNGVAIAAGWLHALALQASGNVVAWGNNGWGQTNVPATATNVIALAAGHSHSLALRADGTVVGWGDNSAGQLSVPPDATNIVAISASGSSSGALLNDPSAPVPPYFGRQPPDANAPAGGTVVLHALALGSRPLVYQWFHEGVLMPDQTNAWIALPNLNLNDTGGYQIVANNASGSVTSRVAVVAEMATLTTQPTNEALILGDTASFSAAAVGSGVLNYQWYFDGAPMSDGGRVTGSATSNLTIVNVQTNDAGTYQLIVANNYGSATSTVATLTVLVPAAITSSPTNQTVLLGSNATFSVTAIGTAPLSYTWYSNGIALVNGGRISGANSGTLTISNTQTNDSGAAFQAIVTNLYGTATSSVATLTVVALVQITGQPSSQAVLLGSNATFAIAATGSGPLNYQWYFNGTALTDGGRISGSATPALTVSNVQSSDAGGYVAVVTNILSSARSLTASLTPQAVHAPSTRYVSLTSTNPMPPYLDWTTAATNIQDAVDAAVAGDLVLVSNGIYNTGGRVVYGAISNRVVVNKAVTVQSVNGPAATVVVGFLGSPAATYHPGRCVYLTNGASLFGFAVTNGGAANSGNLIRDESGGGIWCETTGVVISNCIIAANTAPAAYGGGVFGGTLINCQLTNNEAAYGGGTASNIVMGVFLNRNFAGFQNLNYGGGAYGCVLSNCLLVGNQAIAGSGFGGGAAYSTLTSCVLSNNGAGASGGGMYISWASGCLISSNRAFGDGGGAFSNVLNNCVVKNNFGARVGGGVYYSVLTNCTVVSNSAASVGGVNGAVIVNSIVYDNAGVNIQDGRTVLYTCTIPGMGTGGITNAPLFVNEAAGDLHLQSNSPCINSGKNAYVTSSTDFDGNPRIVGGTVDMGAYEYQTPTSVISYAWLQQYGLPTDGSVDYADLDGTTFNVYQDWIAGLNPTNSASVLAMQTPVINTNSTGLTVSWLSVNNRTYYLQRATNLAAQPAFSTIQSNITGQAGTTGFVDSTATNRGPYFYRVGVQQ